ncbi:hypothetical protein QZH41_007108 [Actinostola sp. cb2023]|nr:hypothetical protein QZH41_007108 [Actinostola sp. cb2023]
MKKLKKIIEEGRGIRKSPKPTTSSEKIPLPKKTPKATLKFEFRWKHAKEGGEYKLVRMAQCGGIRSKDISRYATADECLKEAQDLFFTDGKSTEGNLDEMVTNIADFKNDVIDLMGLFTAEGYKKTHGFRTPRLVLLTKENYIQVQDSSPQQSSDESEQELETSTWDLPTSPSSDNHSDPIDLDSLIGTSDERKRLLDSINDYEASLAIDKAKKEACEAEENAIARKENLRAEREKHAPVEPNKTKPHLVISVRHPNLGIMSRAFTPSTKMLGVYDWIGSLSSSPEHFSLTKPFPREDVYPEENASIYASSTLNMMTRDEPIPLYPDDKKIQFYCGSGDNDCDSTLTNKPGGN